MISWPQDFADQLPVPAAVGAFPGRDHVDRDALLLQPRQRAVPEGARRADQGQGQSALLMPKALCWFRWGAVFTWFSGFLYYFLIVDSEKTGHMPLVYLPGGLVDRVRRRRVAAARRGRRRPAEGRPRRWPWSSRSSSSSSAAPRPSMARKLGREQPHALDHDRRRDRDDHVPERLDDHLAAPEEDHRGDQGDGRDGRRRRRPIRPKWARRAFLASRTNTWLSIPMLFFMGAASHFPIFSTIDKVDAP